MSSTGRATLHFTAVALGCVALLVGCTQGDSPVGVESGATEATGADVPEATSADTGFPEPGDRLEIREAEVDGAHLVISFVDVVCNGTFDHTLQSDSDAVTVSVTLLSFEAGADCETALTLDLDDPLGDRVLIDAATGNEVPLRRNQSG